MNEQPKTIWDIKNPDGSRRFYPAFAHPASAQARAALADMEKWDETHLDREHDLERAASWPSSTAGSCHNPTSGCILRRVIGYGHRNVIWPETLRAPVLSVCSPIYRCFPPRPTVCAICGETDTSACIMRTNEPDVARTA